MPRTPEVCSHVFTPLSQFSNGCCNHLTVLPLRRLIAAFSRRIFFKHTQHRFLRPSLIASCFLPSLSAASLLVLLVTYHVSLIPTYGQSATATLTGTVVDQNDALVANVNIAVINISQGFQRSATTNDEGVFVVPLLPPGNYIVKTEREGFTPAEVRDVVLNVNDQRHLKISLKVGGVDQTVDIVDTSPLINESPSVATVIDRHQIANMPNNGRNFQSLIALSPSVVLTEAGALSGPGQFSVAGQRADANSFTVDGVSANIAVPLTGIPGQAAGGSLPGFSASGGTNNLVSIDALQEFKIETSTYAPEFGRTPGGQVLIATRSGTNDFHGSLFEYFRNDALDANDWFANASRQPKPPLRQNNFGGVLGGPILLPRFGEGGRQPGYDGRNKTFFFFSYEGLRLRQPLFLSTPVPSLAARQAAPVGIQPFLNAFPLPNGPVGANNLATFSASFSNPSSFDATSIRIDHKVNERLTLFGRYNYSPSEAIQRASAGDSLNSVNQLQIQTQTATVGLTFIPSSQVSNELRLNYSRNVGKSLSFLDNFGGAQVPPDSILFPSFASSRESFFSFLLGPPNASLNVGTANDNMQRQFNLVNAISISKDTHQWKFGVDYRRLSPIIGGRLYSLSANFAGVAGALSGRAFSVNISTQAGPLFPVYTNLSLFGQDTWRVNRRLVINYGLRYELNPPPSEANGKNPAILTQIDNLATAALAPAGTPFYKTTYNNFAPRIGASFQLFERSGRETIVRGGFGVFYDLGSNVVANSFVGTWPFTPNRPLSNVAFPLSEANAAAPPFTTNPPVTRIFAYDPDLKLPYTLQWNFAVEQSLGANQTVSAAYVGAAGRRLLRQEQLGSTILVNTRNPLFVATSRVFITRNSATSDYNALQLQFNRRLTRGLQALISYTWSHSIDTASNDALQLVPNVVTDPNTDRGPSDFDIRHAFSASASYDLPRLASTAGKWLLGNWTIDTIVWARSAGPVDVTVLRNIGFGNAPVGIRPDLIVGVPLYIEDTTVGGGRRFNPAAFVTPTALRQGTLGRNALRGFPLFQTDFAIRRQFGLTERLKIQFKTEFFNIFNHPNFGDPSGQLSQLGIPNSLFGRSMWMFGRSLGSGGANGGLNPLYQVGGPRSIQFVLKAQF